MDSASASDVLLMLGDFNARVGSNRLASSNPSRFDGVANDGALWGRALGPFGLGACNQAGEDLLMFCNSNELSIMNTNYKKKESRRGTWTHPATRQSSDRLYHHARRSAMLLRGCECGPWSGLLGRPLYGARKVELGVHRLPSACYWNETICCPSAP